MLSGAKDEIVPKEHMRALWEAVAKRGEKKTPGGKEYKTGLERAKYMEFEDGTHSASVFYHSKARLTNFSKTIPVCRLAIGLQWPTLWLALLGMRG